jgi:hypothetical protein
VRNRWNKSICAWRHLPRKGVNAWKLTGYLAIASVIARSSRSQWYGHWAEWLLRLAWFGVERRGGNDQWNVCMRECACGRCAAGGLDVASSFVACRKQCPFAEIAVYALHIGPHKRALCLHRVAPCCAPVARCELAYVQYKCCFLPIVHRSPAFPYLPAIAEAVMNNVYEWSQQVHALYLLNRLILGKYTFIASMLTSNDDIYYFHCFIMITLGQRMNQWHAISHKSINIIWHFQVVTEPSTFNQSMNRWNTDSNF